MLNALDGAPLFAGLVVGSTDGRWLDAGRLFYTARLIAALVVATLVPILIDRRLRR